MNIIMCWLHRLPHYSACIIHRIIFMYIVHICKVKGQQGQGQDFAVSSLVPRPGGEGVLCHEEYITERVCNSHMVSVPAIWIG